MAQRIWFFSKRFLVGGLIALLCAVPAIAQRSPGQRFISDYATSPKCQIKSGIPEELHMARVCGLGGTVRLSSGERFTKSSLGTRVLTPPVQIETQARSASELYFNDRVVARTLKGRFTFSKGLKKVQLKSLNLEVTTQWQSVSVVVAAKSLFLPGAYDAQVKRFAQAQTVFDETIFELAEGTILAMLPPDVVLTEIQTPQSRIEVGAALSVPSNRVALQDEILEKRPVQVATLSPLLPSLSQSQNQLLASTRSSAVIVRHDPAQNTTQVFALTEGVRVSGSQGGSAVALRGGETVAVVNGVVGPIQTFNLARFYQTTGLANGLGPGQEDAIALEPVEIQRTIRLVRGETLAALEDQKGIFGQGSRTPLDQPRPPVVSPQIEGSTAPGSGTTAQTQGSTASGSGVTTPSGYRYPSTVGPSTSQGSGTATQTQGSTASGSGVTTSSGTGRRSSGTLAASAPGVASSQTPTAPVVPTTPTAPVVIR